MRYLLILIVLIISGCTYNLYQAPKTESFKEKNIKKKIKRIKATGRTRVASNHHLPPELIN